MKQLTTLYKKNELRDYLINIAEDYGHSLKWINEVDDFQLIQFIDLYYYINPNYLSNIDYGYGVRIVDMSEFKLYKDKNKTVELSFQDFLNNPDDIYMTKKFII